MDVGEVGLGIRNIESRRFEYTVEHRPSQFAGEGILLAWVVGTDQDDTPWQLVYRPVPKFWKRSGQFMT